MYIQHPWNKHQQVMKSVCYDPKCKITDMDKIAWELIRTHISHDVQVAVSSHLLANHVSHFPMPRDIGNISPHLFPNK